MSSTHPVNQISERDAALLAEVDKTLKQVQELSAKTDAELTDEDIPSLSQLFAAADTIMSKPIYQE